MVDYYFEFTRSSPARGLIKTLGLPLPPDLERARGAWQGKPLTGSPVAVATTDGGTLMEAAIRALAALGARPVTPGAFAGFQATQAAAAAVDHPVGEFATQGEAGALVMDASGLDSPDALSALHRFFGPLVRRVRHAGRILILARPVEAAADPAAAAASRAVEGFARSLAKETGRHGVTVQVLRVAPGAEGRLLGPMHFLLSAHSAYIDGQTLTVDNVVGSDAQPRLSAPLHDRVALVTGAARGIGAAIAEVLSREGAKVLCLDVPAAEEALQATAARVGGDSLALDITDRDAADVIAGRLDADHGGVDVVVHNAGITRDRTLARMSEAQWDDVLAVNLASALRIDRRLLDGVLHRDGRIVCLSSIAGIAGNPGQTNYAASKAGIIGYVSAQARAVADRGITVNALAPGFIETEMTAAMPIGLRQAGRRLNSLSQGGWPADVAEAAAFLASPGAVGISGQVLRVCGQSVLGA